MGGEQLEGVGRLKQHDIRESRPNELDAGRESRGESNRHGKAGEAGQGGGHSEGIGQVHGYGVHGLGREGEGHAGTDRGGEYIHGLEDPFEISGDEGPGLHGLEVEGVVVALGKAEGPQQDAALDLGPQPFVTGLGDHRRQVPALGAVAVADPIEAAEVAGDLAGADQVVGVDGIAGVGKADFPDLRALAGEHLEGLLQKTAHARLEAFTEVLVGEADAEPLEVLRSEGGQALRAGKVGGGAVQGVPAGHDAQSEGHIRGGDGDGADLVQAGGHGRQAEAAEDAVRRTQGRDIAEAGRQAHGSAGIASESQGCVACGDGHHGATAAAPGDSRRIPGIAGRAEGAVLAAGTHGELIHVGLGHGDRPGLEEASHDGGIVRGPVSTQHPGAAGDGQARPVQVVLEHDGQAQHGGALPGPQPRIGGLGQLEAAPLVHGQDRVEMRIQVANAVEGGPDQGFRGHVTGIKAFAPIHRRAHRHACASRAFYCAIEPGALPA